MKFLEKLKDPNCGNGIKIAIIAVAFLLPITWGWFAPDISMRYNMVFTLIPVGLFVWLKIKHG